MVEIRNDQSRGDMSKEITEKILVGDAKVVLHYPLYGGEETVERVKKELLESYDPAAGE